MAVISRTEDEMLQLSSDIAKQLRKFGLNAKAKEETQYQDTTAMIEYDSDISDCAITIWPGNSKVDIYGSKKHKQAVVVLTESARTIHRTYEIGMSRFEKVDGEFDHGLMVRRARGTFPISLPHNTKFEFEFISYAGYRFTVNATATVPRSVVTFLMGYDEHEQFVCVLPKKVTSVEDAHKVLRPKGVPDKALRQGEFFFVPVTEEEKKILDNIDPFGIEWYALDDGETHFALNVRADRIVYSPNVNKVLKGKLYAIGLVKESRGRHKPLMLKDWHCVYQNTEIESASYEESWD